MPENRLTARSTLGGAAPLDETLDGLRLREVTERGLAWIVARRGREDALRRAVHEAHGVDLPGPGRRVAGATFTYAWAAPGQWLAEAPLGENEDIVARLAPLLGESAAIAEQTDAFLRLELSGARAAEALAKLCPLDLDPRVFGTGSFQRTLMEHQSVFIGRTDDAPTFVLLTPRSSARAFHHALRTAALASRDP